MYKSLYDQFQHWYRDGGTVWFYSDPHFSDEEMKYIRHDYIGDEEQVKRINSKIGRKDTLVILGDIGDVEWVKKLRGYKVLIMGNHDAGASNYKRLIYDSGLIHDNHLFDEVYEGPLFISDKLLLSHEPIEYPYALNIHGHDHSFWSKSDDLHWNLCAEHIGYTPVCIKEIINSGRLKNIPTIHRATIDEAAARKQKKENKNG